MIEMLVVIVITVILLGLVFGPVIQSFNMTRQATAMTTSQEIARKTLEQVSREISQAMFVYDNSNSPINFPCENPDGTVNVKLVPYAKLDLIMPKMIMHCNSSAHPANLPRDYPRGDEARPVCPQCGSSDVEMRPADPLTPDTKIVRYFVGLADPASAIPNHPPVTRDWQIDAGPDNGFVLYRAEFDPYDTTLVKRDSAGKPILDDPNFFYGPHKGAWKAISRVVGPSKDVDLAVLQINTSGNTIDAVTSSIRFQFTQMTNDSFTPAYTTDLAADTPNAVPTIFRAKYGSWASSDGTSTPNIYDVTLIRKDGTYYKANWDASFSPNPSHLVIDGYSAGGVRTPSIFDITTYMGGTLPNPMPPMAFRVDPISGEVRFDFPASHIIKQSEINDMNQYVIANTGGGNGTPVRRYKIDLGGNVTIVPGSEVVVGPDMTPRDEWAALMAPGPVAFVNRPLVRYKRVPQRIGNPGLNEYDIDYGLTDRAEAGYISFSSALDEAIPVWQKFGTGGGDIPASIEIRYKYQLNQDGDVVVGNYATKTLMSVTMGIRFYDSNSGKVHPVELTNKVRIRNLMR